MVETIETLNQTDKDKLNRQVYEYLEELSYYFEDLEKRTKRYIPDYAVQYNKPFTVAEVCELSVTVNKIYSLLDTGIYRVIKTNSGGHTRAFLRDWLSNYIAKNELDLLYCYLERINTFRHYIATIHNIDVANNNVIVTIFRRSGNGGELYKAIDYINSLKNKIKELLPDNSDCDCNTGE